MPAPVVLFVYNRPEHTRKTVEALQKNRLARESRLFIFSDGPKNKESLGPEKHRGEADKVSAVREYVHSLSGFKEIIIEESIQNRGLASSIIAGVNRVFKESESLIVLEDDLVTSSNFLLFMNEALKKYRDNLRIWSICGYSLPIKIPFWFRYDVYLSPRAGSWGWATWKDRWLKNDWDIRDYNTFLQSRAVQKKFNKGGRDMTPMLRQQMEGEIDSWAIRWGYNQFKDKSWTVYPVISKVQNIGTDASGRHCAANGHYISKIDDGQSPFRLPDRIPRDLTIERRFRNFYTEHPVKLIIKKVLRKTGLFSLAKTVKIKLKRQSSP